LAVFQGGPSRTGGKAPISGFIRVDPPRRRKNSQPAAARRVALKMGRRQGEMYRCVGGWAFAKSHQLRKAADIIKRAFGASEVQPEKGS
jgi:hypothetical protein